MKMQVQTEKQVVRVIFWDEHHEQREGTLVGRKGRILFVKLPNGYVTEIKAGDPGVTLCARKNVVLRDAIDTAKKLIALDSNNVTKAIEYLKTFGCPAAVMQRVLKIG